MSACSSAAAPTRPARSPAAPYRARESFWDPPRGLTGMYHYWSFKGIDALVSAGLGGGSLIYANVLLRKDEKWFVQEDVDDGGCEYWPVTRGDLDPHYDRVEQMIGAPALPVRARAVLAHAEDQRLQVRRRDATGSSGSCRRWPSPSPTRARPPRAGRADRGDAAQPARPRPRRRAGCAASATSAATSAPRTRSTTTTSRTPSTRAPRSGRCATCARSSRSTGGGYAVGYAALRRARRRRRRATADRRRCAG